MRSFCYLIDWETNSKCRIETTDESTEFDRFDRYRIWLISRFEIKRKTHSFSYCIQISFELFLREHNCISRISLTKRLDANLTRLTKLTKFRKTRRSRFLLYNIHVSFAWFLNEHLEQIIYNKIWFAMLFLMF